MRLKSLDLVGFKSFLDPTTIGFAPGISVVVGPNGCGKSNLVDAIRWVMGEQAPTRLRGKTAEDLIYAGNDAHPAAGMAEVTLVIEAQEDRPLPAPYSALSELAVTRRLYRSGDSVYLINRIPCRLKDITEFFMAAQIHSRGYALIEQGRIEQIVQARPEQLRRLIEEAAGLALFKERRELSERKLARVKDNLSRLNDVLAEIDRQLAFARRQARKAEAFKLVKRELDELERLHAARRLIAQRDQLVIHCQREAELGEQARNARRDTAERQAAADQAAQAARTAQRELGEARRELDTLQNAAAERNRSQAFLERRLDTISELEPGLRARLAELEARTTLARAARAHTGATLAREKQAIAPGADSELKDLTARHNRASEDLSVVEEQFEELKDTISDLIREAAIIRSRLGDLAGERSEIEQRLRIDGERRARMDGDLADARAELEACESEIETLNHVIEALETEERRTLESEIKAREQREHLATRLGGLEEAVRREQRNGVRETRGATADRLARVMESLNGDRPQSDPTLLEQALNAPAELRPALEAALGDQLDAAIVESPRLALRAIELLRETGGGRLSFVPQSEVAAMPRSAVEAPGIAGRLIDMLDIEPRFRPVAEAMLGHVMLAGDLRAALAASNLNGHGTLFVTREGDVIWPGRIIAGGSAQQVSTGGDSAGASRAEIEHTEADLKKVVSRLSESRAAHERVRADLARARGRLKEAQRIAERRRTDLASFEQDALIAESRRRDHAARLEEIRHLTDASNARLKEMAVRESQERSRLKELEAAIAVRQAAVQGLGQAMLEAAAALKALESHLSNLEQAYRHADQTVRELESRIGEHRAELGRCAAEREEFTAELGKLAAQAEAAASRQEEIEGSLQRLARQAREREAALEAARTLAEQAVSRQSDLESRTLESRLGAERARTLSEELARSFSEKFGSDFDLLAPELEAALAGRDPTRDEERLEELRRKADRIGEVNLAAESEVKELEDRAEVLQGERADLEKALADLSRTISTLNREARRRFSETFEGAARNFADLFPKLFPGGRGRLELVGDSDVLEAGVSIMVQPAGKRVKEIGLLSGGEKALSAMALVFSLFLLNPSPFCLMDEVDAPLDEFSLAAFTSLLSELKERSQFLVITHNQRTMERADQIHGITMERPGISQVISLRVPRAA